MPYRKFNSTVRELSPILNDSRKTGVRRLIDNFAGFAACGVKGEPKYLDLTCLGSDIQSAKSLGRACMSKLQIGSRRRSNSTSDRRSKLRAIQ
jgi:hypothetical protein